MWWRRSRSELHLGSARVKLSMMGLCAWGVGLIGLHRVRLLALLIVLGAASSCASTPVGEFTADDCTNGDDDDRDGLSDCDDSDCWVFCPVRGNVQVGDASSFDVPDASPDAGAKPPVDSGKPPAMHEDDAGAEPTDASTPDDDDSGTANPCKCQEGQTCIDGVCRPKPSPSIEGMYKVTVKSAYVPLGPSDDRCFDYTGACITRIPILCECERPDPYVVVLQNKTVLSRATTPEVRDTVSPTWLSAPSATITLKATDTLTFRTFDWDGLGQDQAIFDCMPDLSALEKGADALSCSPRPGSTAAAPAGASYSITASVVRVVTDAAAP